MPIYKVKSDDKEYELEASSEHDAAALVRSQFDVDEITSVELSETEA